MLLTVYSRLEPKTTKRTSSVNVPARTRSTQRRQDAFKNRRESRSRRGKEAELFLAPKSASYTENEIKGNARPHPGPLSHEREKHPPCLGIFMLCGATLPHGDSHRRLPFLNTPCQQRRPRKIVDRTGCNLENSPTFMLKRCFFIAALLPTARLRAAETNIAAPDSLARPLSLEECIDLALKQNSAILKGQSDSSDLSRDVSGWNAGVRGSW